MARTIATRLAKAEVTLTDDAARAISRYGWPGNLRELRNVLRSALMSGDGRHISLHDLRTSPVGQPSDRVTAEPNNRVAKPVAMPRQIPSHIYDEKVQIMDALTSARWNISRAARNLGIGRATIHRKMKLYGIERPNKED